MTLNGINRTDSFNSLLDASTVMQNAQSQGDTNKFLGMVEAMKNNAAETNVSSSEINSSHKLNGDYTEGFHGLYTSEKDKTSKPVGAASRSGTKRTIDRTSTLYEQALELENYFVKEMLSSMRKTISKTNLMGQENDYAQEMYEDMLYDNYAEALTKNAQFGLADQIYLELSEREFTA